METCKYCGGDCPEQVLKNGEPRAEFLCYGYAGDIDNQYGTEEANKMKIDTDDLSYLFNEATSILSSHDADELYELLTADDVSDKIHEAISNRHSPEGIEAICQMLWGGYESKIGRA